jgi:hypothetical protein
MLRVMMKKARKMADTTILNKMFGAGAGWNISRSNQYHNVYNPAVANPARMA